MLATGGSASRALQLVKDAGCRDVRLLCIIGCPEGLEVVRSEHPDVAVTLAALDPGLNGQAYIVPGLGDAGDRIFGTR
jgi:uracil phosphoribosyltransferase